jgi:signal transduction histidine kinase
MSDVPHAGAHESRPGGAGAAGLEHALETALEISERRRSAAEALADVARVLSQALDPDAVSQIIVERIVKLLSARSGVVFHLDDGKDLEVLAACGEMTGWLHPRFVLPGHSGTAGLAVRQRRTVTTPDLLTDPRIEVPAAVRGIIEASSHRAALAVPLAVAGRVIGALAVGDAGGRAFTEDDIRLAEAFAGHAAVALHNAELFRETARRRDEAEVAQARLGFLADASTVMSLSLHYDETLHSIARLAVPRLADCSCVHTVDDDGSIRGLAVVHVDPEKLRLVQMLQTTYPIGLDAPLGPAHVIQTGRSEFYPQVDEQLIATYARTSEEFEWMKALDISSAMVVPLAGRGGIVGALTFARSRPARPYERIDLALAEDLGRRAGLALENSRLYSAAQLADRTKDEFVTILAHELRTPLSTILASARVIAQRASPEGVRGPLAVIERQVQYQAQLLDDLLDLARVRRGEVALRRATVALGTVVADAVETVRPLIEERGHRLIMSMPEEAILLEADRTRLTQVVSNLLSNAAKYTPTEGRVVLTVTREGNEALISVADNGVGIPREMLGDIFGLFTRVTVPGTSTKGGLGIGLALVRKLVELHGGSVVARSEGPGRGSEFVVRLPLARTAGDTSQGAARHAEPHTQNRRR